MLDKSTLLEEVEIIQRRAEQHQPIDRAYAVKCFRELRRLEDKERDDIPRSDVTGY